MSSALKRCAFTLVLLLSAPLARAAAIEPFAPDHVLVFAGDGKAIGQAEALAQKDEIKSLVDGWLVPRLNQVPYLLDGFARLKARAMDPFVPQDFKDEIQAVADTSGIPYERLLIANAAPDITELARKPFGCSTFVVMPERSATGGVLYGRNLDYSKSDILRSYWRPTVFAKTGKLKILSINLPGLSGVLTAINEKGVMMARMTSYNKDMTAHGLPSMLLFRKVLEDATTAEEAAELYRKLPRTVAVNVMIADPTTALVFETTAHQDAVRRPNAAGVVYSANHFETPALKDRGHDRDERWPFLARHDGDRQPLGVDEVLDLLVHTGRSDGNILATVADYKNHRLIFGSDAEGLGKAAGGALYAVDWEAAFAKQP